MAETIKCIKLNGFGGYDKISLETVPSPLVQPGQVLVRVKACGMNFCDLLTRQGFRPLEGMVLPFIMGLECSGTVEQVDDQVNSIKVGDRVMCWNFLSGMWSELAQVPEANCYPMPDSMTFEEAAAIPIQYLTAYLAILDYGHLRPGQNVLIQAAAGGVGWAATQIAKSVPNVKIFGTASTNKFELITKNGVEHPIDYRNGDFVKDIQRIAPEGVDVVLDCLAGAELTRAQNILRPMGRIISIGIMSAMCGENRSIFEVLRMWWKTKNVSFFDLLTNNRAVCGLNTANLMTLDPDRFRKVIQTLVQMFEDGLIKPRIDSVHSFNEVHNGMKRLTERLNVGKVILVP